MWSPVPLALQSFRMTTSYYFMEMPTWISPSLTNLSYLNINLDEVTQSDIYILGSLQALISLDLWFKTDPRTQLVVHGGFRSLKILNYIHDSHGSRGVGYLVFESEALQKLEKLTLPFFITLAKDYDFYLGIEHLPRLKFAHITFSKRGATSDDVMAAEAALINEADAHPNHPMVTIVGEQ